MNKELHILSKYPEFYALKKELLDHVASLTEELLDLKTDDGFAFQAAVKVQSINDTKELLTKLGLIASTEFKEKRKTYE